MPVPIAPSSLNQIALAADDRAASLNVVFLAVGGAAGLPAVPRRRRPYEWFG